MRTLIGLLPVSILVGCQTDTKPTDQSNSYSESPLELSFPQSADAAHTTNNTNTAGYPVRDTVRLGKVDWNFKNSCPQGNIPMFIWEAALVDPATNTADTYSIWNPKVPELFCADAFKTKTY